MSKSQMMNKENDSIVRYCKPTQIQGDKILVGAFLLRKKDPELKRPKDEKELSVYHYDYYKESPLKNIKDFAEEKMALKPEGCFAVIKYSDIEKDIKENLSVDIDIKPACKPHYLISNLYQCDEDAAIYFAKNVKSFTKIKDIK